ncbi:hypothetical protein BH24PSE2_BH24PSE2_24230 [soil metagenome]
MAECFFPRPPFDGSPSMPFFMRHCFECGDAQRGLALVF